MIFTKKTEIKPPFLVDMSDIKPCETHHFGIDNQHLRQIRGKSMVSTRDGSVPQLLNMNYTGFNGIYSGFIGIYSVFNGIYKLYKLVGGIPTPLKNDGVRQLG